MYSFFVRFSAQFSAKHMDLFNKKNEPQHLLQQLWLIDFLAERRGFDFFNIIPFILNSL